jgi:hypothetical protein
MLNDAANPFKMLSAYLTTTATTNPPMACNKITATTTPLYPKKKPRSSTCARSPDKKTPANPSTMDDTPIWMLRIHSDVPLFFRMRSKYTPENPDVHAAASTATNPIVVL